MADHTPGPWFAPKGHRRFISANLDGNGDELPGVPKNIGIWIAEAKGPDAEANAHLIAAAPDMLAALRQLLAYADRFNRERDGHENDPAPNDARAAITKATQP